MPATPAVARTTDILLLVLILKANLPERGDSVKVHGASGATISWGCLRIVKSRRHFCVML